MRPHWILSHKFKPGLDVYRWALEQVDVKAGDAMIVAAH